MVDFESFSMDPKGPTRSSYTLWAPDLPFPPENFDPNQFMST